MTIRSAPVRLHAFAIQLPSSFFKSSTLLLAGEQNEQPRIPGTAPQENIAKNFLLFVFA